MQVMALFVSGSEYCDSSVVASCVTLSSCEPYAKNAGQPVGQPLASASLGPPTTFCVLPCSTVMNRLVEAAACGTADPNRLEPNVVCWKPRGGSGKLAVAMTVLGAEPL